MRQLLFFCFAFLAGLGANAVAAVGTVYTVNYPLQYFAERIAGDDVDIVFPVPADIDPAYWEPSVDDLVSFQMADLILLNGAGYARWLEEASLPRRRLVDTSKSFQERLIISEENVTHSHGPEGSHSHTGNFAFTTWLDISLARKQALAVKDAFVRRWPDQKDGFNERFQQLDQDLQILEEKAAEAFRPMNGDHVFASHPVYQYLARAQGLETTSFHWEPDITPSEADWAEFDRKLQRLPVDVMIWEDTPTEETRRELIARNIRILIIPPLFQAPETGDFTSALSKAIGQL
jgi:zinc transport system substrate-binding protein